MLRLLAFARVPARLRALTRIFEDQEHGFRLERTVEGLREDPPLGRGASVARLRQAAHPQHRHRSQVTASELLGAAKFERLRDDPRAS